VVALRRKAGFASGALFRTRFARSAALTSEAAEGISDLQFTGSYRVPFQFSRFVRSA
jgi:glutamate-1-semialdehyde 2,1-aminomutase